MNIDAASAGPYHSQKTITARQIGEDMEKGVFNKFHLSRITAKLSTTPSVKRELSKIQKSLNSASDKQSLLEKYIAVVDANKLSAQFSTQYNSTTIDAAKKTAQAKKQDVSFKKEIPPETTEELLKKFQKEAEDIYEEGSYNKESGEITYHEASAFMYMDVSSRHAALSLIAVSAAREFEVNNTLRPGEMVTIKKYKTYDSCSRNINAVAQSIESKIDLRDEIFDIPPGFISLIICITGYGPRQTLQISRENIEVVMGESELQRTDNQQKNTWTLCFSSPEQLEDIVKGTLPFTTAFSEGAVCIQEKNTPLDDEKKFALIEKLKQVVSDSQENLPRYTAGLRKGEPSMNPDDTVHFYGPRLQMDPSADQ